MSPMYARFLHTEKFGGWDVERRYPLRTAFLRQSRRGRSSGVEEISFWDHVSLLRRVVRETENHAVARASTSTGRASHLQRAQRARGARRRSTLHAATQRHHPGRLQSIHQHRLSRELLRRHWGHHAGT
eukprot:7386544-Prymnesium_polylepis.1